MTEIVVNDRSHSRQCMFAMAPLLFDLSIP